MSSLLEFIDEFLFPILATVITTVVSYIGITIKKKYERYANNKMIKEIINSTVLYVEQRCKNGGKCSTDKFNLAKKKVKEWLKEEKLSVSDTEIETLIESAVMKLNDK